MLNASSSPLDPEPTSNDVPLPTAQLAQLPSLFRVRGVNMRRRKFLGALSGAIAWPAIVRAQQPAMPVIGVISSANARAWEPLVAAFRTGLGEAGFTERQNVAIEYRFADGQYERLPGMAADLV